jgi:disease resistance protein RPM1
MVRVNVHPSTTPEGFKGFIARSLRLLAEVKTRHQIATEIRDMRTLVKEVAERRNRYKVDSSVTTASTAPEIDRRLQVSMKNQQSSLQSVGQEKS